MKTCYKCKETRALDQFHKDKYRIDGFGNRCKECTKNRPKQTKSYPVTEEGRIARNIKRSEYEKSERGKTSRKRTRDKYKNASICRERTNDCLRTGKLIRNSSCEKCNSISPLEKHHCDYNEPLDVMWLCRTCHTDWHKHNEPLNRIHGIFNPPKDNKN